MRMTPLTLVLQWWSLRLSKESSGLFKSSSVKLVSILQQDLSPRNQVLVWRVETLEGRCVTSLALPTCRVHGRVGLAHLPR